MKAIYGWLKNLLDAIDGDERFLMTVGCGFVNTVLVATKAIDPLVYRDIILGTVAVFIGSSAYTTSVQIKQDGQSGTDK